LTRKNQNYNRFISGGIFAMTITFERATADDAQEMFDIQHAAFRNDAVIYPGVPADGPSLFDSVARVIKKIEKDDYYKIVYEGQSIGGIVIDNRGEGHFHLDLIYLDPVYHGQGIGTQAMQFIERTYRAAKWTLHTPLYATRNHRFYENFGYVKIGEEHYPGISLILYEKRMDSQD
jgi:GNAT superfamily N-acetyltransferase